MKHSRKIDENICSIYVDGQLIATGTSDQKDIAKLNAAKEALAKLDKSVVSNIGVVCQVNEMNEIEAAKQKLHELCDKKKWPKPSYRYSSFIMVNSTISNKVFNCLFALNHN